MDCTTMATSMETGDGLIEHPNMHYYLAILCGIKLSGDYLQEFKNLLANEDSLRERFGSALLVATGDCVYLPSPPPTDSDLFRVALEIQKKDDLPRLPLIGTLDELLLMAQGRFRHLLDGTYLFEPESYNFIN